MRRQLFFFDSDAALRQQTQIDYIASSDPRLVKKSWLVARCSWLVKTCHYTRLGCDEISLTGFPSTAVRFSSRLAIPYSHDLTD